MIDVKFTTENKDYIPFYSTKESAGFDMRAFEDVVLLPGEWKAIKTGWRFELPKGYVMLGCSRSGLASKKGLVSHLSPGVVDSDYRGEVFACVRNVSDTPKEIKKGDRVLQFVIVPSIQANFILSDSLEETERGEGGFGSTGVK